jgi:inorganic pyrophosphatase
MSSHDTELHQLLSLLFQAHPWHGVAAGEEAPSVVNAYIEIVPTDAVKYELSKRYGHLRLDRPQRYSSFPPTLYGFIPQSFCGDRVAAICEERCGIKGIRGDGDPMDICVLTEKPLAHGGLIVRARPIGGLRMVDGEEADDKIIAVLDRDVAYGHIQDLSDVPHGLVERLQHYFLTYKQLPQEAPRRVEIAETYARNEALNVINRSFEDYRTRFGDPNKRIGELRRLLKSV